MGLRDDFCLDVRVGVEQIEHSKVDLRKLIHVLISAAV